VKELRLPLIGALAKVLGVAEFKQSTRLRLALIGVKTSILRRALQHLKPSFSGLPSQYELIKSGDFDVLVVLDACRYDYLAALLPSLKPIPVQSPASTTPTWLARVWGRLEISSSVVYVSANPMIGRKHVYGLGDSPFMEVVEVWRNGWSDYYSTVPPARVSLAALMTVRKLSLRGLRLGRDYKLVLHYIQPHAPYRLLNTTCRRLFNVLRGRIAITPTDMMAKGMMAPDYVTLGMLYDTLERKKLVDRILRAAYMDNLRWALNALKLLRKLHGAKIIVTADHGELLGEHGLYFHFEAPLSILRTVPWLRLSRGA